MVRLVVLELAFSDWNRGFFQVGKGKEIVIRAAVAEGARCRECDFELRSLAFADFDHPDVRFACFVKGQVSGPPACGWKPPWRWLQLPRPAMLW